MGGTLAATEAKHVRDALCSGVWPGGGPLHDGRDLDSKGEVGDAAHYPTMPLVGPDGAEIVCGKNVPQIGGTVAETGRRTVISDRTRKNVTGIDGEVVA